MSNSNVVVRAVTFFTGKIENAGKVRDEISYALSTMDEVYELLTEKGYTVFTKRISLPPGSSSIVSKVTGYLNEDTWLSTGFMENVDETLIVELTLSGVYTPILHSDPLNMEKAKTYSRIIHKASSQDPVAATRISIGFHTKDFLTPYFPGSSSKGQRAIGLAFLYPTALIELLEKGIEVERAIDTLFREFDEIALSIHRKTGLETYVDYSLSPWMEDSVVKVFRALGSDVTRPGFNYLINTVNNLIERYASRDLRIGFNEVMLPYAEDSELIKLGEIKLLRARDFLLYASTCVAGVDMVVVPEDIEALAGLIADTATIALVKKKPLGFRAIPVNESPGNRIKLGKFGEIAVIDY